jgi:soluble lytic murein transglycosylase
MQLGRAGLIVVLSALGAPCVAGCAEQRVTSAPPAASTVQGATTVAAVSAPSLAAPVVEATLADASAAVAPSIPASAAEAWVESVRLERWAEAAAAIDALPEDRRARPELRYVRARAALATGDAARAVELLTGLEAALPLLSAAIERYRADAQAVAGPYAEAARFFARSKRARDLVRAAEAFDRAGDAAEAKKAIEQAIAAAARAKSTRDEASARAVRARLASAAGRAAQAAVDVRWVALHAPATAEGRATLTELERDDRALTTKERLEVVEALLDAGSGPDALALVEGLAKRPDAPRADVLHARAMALYTARDYPEASKAFLAAAALKGARQPEELFYAARALARADKDDEALRRYLDLAARFKKSYWAERASYLAARMHLTNGRWKEAAAAYARYLAAFSKGDKRQDAEYERALALVSSGPAGAKAARQALAKLAKGARPDEAARLRELEGVAALRAGDRAGAVRLWTEVAEELPLSWAALASRARLAAAGAALPPLLEPATPRPIAPLDAKLPDVPALLASVGLDADAEDWLAANEHAAAGAYAGREHEALCAMYGQLAPAKRRYRVGLSAVGLPSLMRSPADADRWTWECVYPRPYAAEVASLEERHGVPRGFLHALMRQESGFDPGVVSSAAAVGLLQLLPSTAKQIAVESACGDDPAALTSPGVNLRLGAAYVGKLLKTFRGSLVLAAASYNAGPKAVSHWLEAAGGAEAEVDLWVARIPYEETRKYVAKVIGNHARYQWLAGGDAAVAPLPLELPADARCEADAY